MKKRCFTNILSIQSPCDLLHSVQNVLASRTKEVLHHLLYNKSSWWPREDHLRRTLSTTRHCFLSPTIYRVLFYFVKSTCFTTSSEASCVILQILLQDMSPKNVDRLCLEETSLTTKYYNHLSVDMTSTKQVISTAEDKPEKAEFTLGFGSVFARRSTPFFGSNRSWLLRERQQNLTRGSKGKTGSVRMKVMQLKDSKEEREGIC
jgi:hypothetical protein